MRHKREIMEYPCSFVQSPIFYTSVSPNGLSNEGGGEGGGGLKQGGYSELEVKREIYIYI